MAIDDLLDEHEQGERVRTWLRKNALGILGGLALGIAAIYGWRAWVSHQASQQEQAHTAYAQALKQLDAGQVEQAGTLLAGQEGTYATLAALRVAKAQVEAGKPDEAIATLRGIQVDPSLREVVDERLAQLFNATGKPEEALKLLEGDAGSTALELRGDALLASGNRDQARDAYADALAGTDVASPARRRIELKLQEVGGTLPEPAEAG
ncbi:MAG: tetratricopeptide repeat protein [Xanthomonadales bacterium]|nr:tetratricopeptide repeat protein [Pseudoxanthomonas sp.]MBP8741563.1 tetratricopeptide repeat protein [Pseudoxanthomonas sp.]MBP8803882.1 tetratricopeptide repeat protein [Pseudoxanthomonas sp.]MDZ3798320.1 tetratricopeptide repeat protein [Xanthomonadales bacterium]TXI33020.1 MAG: tetratricopeptide repeat protein [Ottowia sp.]